VVFELQVEKWIRVNRRPRKRKRREAEEVFEKVGSPKEHWVEFLRNLPLAPEDLVITIE